jgi:hypothetical protein
MTLEDYFTAIEGFVLRDGGRTLARLLTRLWGREVASDGIDRLLIRYEKYGTLYQIASVEVFSGEGQVKFAVSTALSPEAKETLHHEFELSMRLDNRFGLPYLPRMYSKDAVKVEREEGVEAPVMCLSEWFEGYHEWHFSGDEARGAGIIIWDLGAGYRLASEKEAREIIRQASRILTLYYDTETYHQIFPWHHGAGDFVVRPYEGGIDVKLITARGYEPIVFFVEKEEIGPLRAILFFFLYMSVKMRLDKSEGMGQTVWAEASVLDAVVEGFFQALMTKEGKGDCGFGGVEDLLKAFRSMGEEGLRGFLCSTMDICRRYDPVDFAVIERHLDGHAGDLYGAIQNFAG